VSTVAKPKTVAEVVVYALLEVYVSYWTHRFLHSTWGYRNFHHVHHKVTAPTAGFATAYGHWADLTIGGMATIAGPVIVPGHVTTHWLWFAIRTIGAIETHSG
jgi:sterol desaturase/sphingolipid hydroxylase (fatty acid hydroxylase superfamily)